MFSFGLYAGKCQYLPSDKIPFSDNVLPSNNWDTLALLFHFVYLSSKRSQIPGQTKWMFKNNSEISLCSLLMLIVEISALYLKHLCLLLDL